MSVHSNPKLQSPNNNKIANYKCLIFWQPNLLNLTDQILLNKYKNYFNIFLLIINQIKSMTAFRTMNFLSTNLKGKYQFVLISKKKKKKKTDR